MPIQQLGATLGVRSTYVELWADKPAANSRPVGSRITVGEWSNSDWYTNGTYWLPVGGRAVVHSPFLVGAQATGAATLTLVASVPGWQLPADLAQIPGLMIEAWMHGAISAPSAAQERQIYVGTEAVKNAVTGLNSTATNTGPRVWGEVTRRADGDWQSYAPNSALIVPGTSMATTSAASMLASPIQLYYRGGNPDGTEILTVGNFSLAVGVG